MILNELNKATARWSANSQPGVLEANITALGNSTDTYTVSLKNGGQATNISGPSGLSIGSSVIIANYPGKTKKYVILQKAKGGNTQTITTVNV